MITETLEAREALLHALCRIRDAGPRNVLFDICYNVHTMGGTAAKYELYRLFERLNLDREYPVTHPDYPDTDKGRRAAYDVTHDLWAGEYGGRRRALVVRIIAQLERELNVS